MGNDEVRSAEQVVGRIMAAMNAQDIDEYLAMQHPQVELFLPGGVTLRGRDEVRQYLEAQWTAFPDGHLTCVNQVAIRNKAASEIVLSATHSGPLATPNGPVPPTGQRIDLRFVAVHQVEDGMASSERVYFDQLDMLLQLGLASAPGNPNAP
jgi:predicted ester cyclase